MTIYVGQGVPAVPESAVGAANGVASLTGTTLTSSQVPLNIETGASIGPITAAGTTITTGQHIFELDATSASFTQNLPNPTTWTGGKLSFVAITTTAHIVTLSTPSGNIVPPGASGSTTVTLGNQGSGATYSAIDLVVDPSAANWRIV